VNEPTALAEPEIVPLINIRVPGAGALGNIGSWGTSGTISGSASAVGSFTVSNVKLTIQNVSTNMYWNGSAWQSSATTVTATGTTSWSYVFGSANLANSDLYYVTATVTDSGAHTTNSGLTSFYYYGAGTGPSVSVTAPGVGELGVLSTWSTITGAAAAHGSTGTAITGVTVTIENLSNYTYWNGSSWQSTLPSPLVVATGTTSWSFTIASSKFTNGNVYSITATATQTNSSIASASTPATTFTWN